MNNSFMGSRNCGDRELRILPELLLRNKQWEIASPLLYNLKFMVETVKRLGIDQLQQEYAGALRILPKEEGWYGKLLAINRILDRQSHFLRNWNPNSQPSYFLQQIHNQSYLMGFLDIFVQTEEGLQKNGFPYLGLFAYYNIFKDASEKVDGHIGGVYKVAVSSDGQYIFSGSEDLTIKVWKQSYNPSNWKLLHTLEGHNGSILGLYPMDSKRYLASSSSDQTIKIWDYEKGQLIETILGHSSDVFCVSMTDDELYLIAGAYDGTVGIWDLLEGKMIKTLKGHTKPVVCLSINSDNKVFMSGSEDRTFKLWDLKTFKELHTFKGHKNEVTNVKFLLDQNTIVSSSADSTIKFWNYEMKSEKEVLKSDGWILDFAITVDGKYLAATDDSNIVIWDIETKKPVRKLSGHTDIVHSVALFPRNSNLLVSGSRDGTMCLWDILTGQLVFHFKGVNGMVNDILVGPNNKAVVSYGTGEIKIFNTKNADVTRNISLHTASVNRLFLSLDGFLCGSSSDDKHLKIWETESGEAKLELEHKKRIFGGVFTAKNDGIIFAYAGGIKYLDIKTRKVIRHIRNKKWGITEVAITQNGKRVLFGGEDGILRVWDIQSWSEVFALEGHESDISDISVIQNRYALTSSNDGTIKVWDLKSGKLVNTTDYFDNVVSICKTTSLDNIIAISPNALGVFRGDDGKLIFKSNTVDDLWCCDSSSDGKTILLGDYTGGVYFYRLQQNCT